MIATKTGKYMKSGKIWQKPNIYRNLSIFLLVTSLVFTFLLVGQRKDENSPVNNNVNKLGTPLKEKVLSKEFKFSTKDSKDKEYFLKYNIVSAKLVNTVANKGQLINGKENENFLILSLELQNDNNVGLKVNSADFVRMIGGSNKKYAADFYNGVVDVAPISIKKDELAFIVSSNTKELKFEIGEIEDKKEEVRIMF